MEFSWTSLSTRITTAQLVPYMDVFNQHNLDVANAYGVQPWVSSVYSSVADLPVDDSIPSTVMDSLDDPTAEAFHTLIGERGSIETLPDDLLDAALHEQAEARIDLTCDQWKTRPDGTQQAYEVCDPTQGHSYQINGQAVACFVLPAYWETGSAGPWCKCGQLTAPFQLAPDGYAVIIDKSGDETQVFGRVKFGGSRQSHVNAALKLTKRHSRLLRRLRGR